uniref:Papilin n=1 Tax=Phasianus colchicus TaxID=9054 RepID=A0A669PM78_PHACC
MLIFFPLNHSILGGHRMRRQAGLWGSWGEWGKCSRSCGGGVSVRQRRCYFQRTESASSCIGPTQSYRSCNIQSCPESSRDFRAEQCAEFDGTEFQGKKYKWLPYYGAPNKCELNCIPKGENFYYRHKETVIDGTTCEPGKRDICVEGVCQAVGCDNILESTKKEDKCLQCGGDNSTCYDVKGTFDVPNLPKGYNQMFIIPVGATSIQIKEVMPSRNFMAVKNVQGDYYLNGHWTIDFSRTLHIASTVMHYDRGSEGDLAPELLHARGPTTEPLVIELISQEPNPGVQYEYYLPTHRHSTGYSWSYSSWSECSSECGGGFQSRLVFCTIDNEIYPDYMCSNKPRPDNNRTCGHQTCPQTKRWKTGEWGPCSATCGGGTQTRSVYCVAFDGQNSQGVVDNAECMAFAQQPHSSQPCNRRQCATWSTGPWSECSASCGEGVQTRSVTCRTQQGSQAQDFACLMEPKPPATQPCLKEKCIQEVGWHVGDWGLCSKSCSSGIRTRQVICTDGDSKFYSADKCKAIQPQKPATLGSCNVQPCYLPQQVPSMQDTTGYDISRQSLLMRYNPNSPPTGSEFCLFGFLSQSSNYQLSITQYPTARTGSQNCYQTPHGCCPDGHTPASGPSGRGCSFNTCHQNRYGCCPDGVSAAQGPNNMGCSQHDSDFHMRRNQPATAVPTVSTKTLWVLAHPSGECRSSVYGCCFDSVASASGPEGEGCLNRPNYPYPVMCLLPSAHGPCANWTTRWYFVTVVGKCNRFWYGGCHGNKNSFASEEECMRVCHSSVGISPLEHQPSSGTGALRQQDTGSRFHMGTAQGNQQWGAQQSRLKSLSQLHLTRETAVPGPSQKQSSSGQQVLPHEGVSGIPFSFRAILEEAKPSLVTADKGQNIQLVCKASMSPFSRVEWLKDGRPVSSDRHTYQSDSSLVISHVKLEDAGTYTCFISDGRTERRRQIQLQIIGNSSSTYIIYLLLPLLQKRGFVVLSIRHRQQSDGALVISRVSSEDAGFFTCIASNGRDQDQRQVLLRPLGGLRITGHLPSIKVSEGETAQLHCTVTGNNVNIRWSRNGVPVRADGHRIHLSQDGSLTISNVQLADEGSYTCSAYSSSNSVSASTEVKVLRSRPSSDRECVDQPHLANCGLIVQAQLCSNEYYASFCCASCSRYQPLASPPHRSG